MSGPSTPSAPSGDTPSFEQAISRLHDIVEKLESGELPLDQSLALFEEGVKLARTSQKTLDLAERRLDELLSVSADGTAKTAPLADPKR